MSSGLIDALAGGLGAVGGSALGELAGGALGLDPALLEAIGGAVGGGLGAGLTSKSVTGGLLGAAGGALAGPAALGGIEGLVGGNFTNLFGGGGVGVGGSAAPISLGGVSSAPTGPTGSLTPSGGLSAAGAAGAAGGEIGSTSDVQSGLTDPNSPYYQFGANDPTAAGGGGIAGFLSNNKGWLLPAAGLALTALKGNSQTPQEAALQGQAGNLQNLSNQLTQGLVTGNLPAGAQAQVQAAVEAGKARIRSQFAGMGLSGSTMETEALNSVDQQALAQTFQIAQNMATTGLQASGQAATIDQALMNEQLAQDQALQQSIAAFASAMAGGSPYGYGYPGYSPYGYAQPGATVG